MYEVGRLCVKLAGRDAGKKCVIIGVLEDNLVLIDGQTRRRKCNVKHIEPLNRLVKIKKKASHSDVVSALKKEGVEVVVKTPIKKTEKKEKPKKKSRTKKTEKSSETKKTKKKPKKESKKKSKK